MNLLHHAANSVPIPEKGNERAPAVSIRALVELTRSQRLRIFFAACCMGVAALATAGYAYVVGPVIRFLFLPAASASAATDPTQGFLDRFSAGLAGVHPVWLGVGILVLAAVKGAAFFGQNVLGAQVSQRVLHYLRARMYAGFTAKNPLDQLARSAGELVARFTVDAETVEKGVGTGLIGAVRSILQIACLAGLVLCLDPLLGAVGLVAFPLAAMVIVRLGRSLRQQRAAVHRAYGEIGTAVNESAAGLGVIRAFGAEQLMQSRFVALSDRLRRRTERAFLIQAFSSPLNELLAAAALAITLWYAQHRIAAGTLSPEAFISFFTALFLLYQPVKGLGQAHHALQSALAALGRIAPLLDGATPKHGGSTDLPLDPGPHRVEVLGIEAGYGDQPSVLNGLNLAVGAGERLAVVGRSGSGKTTLLQMLQGFLVPRRGEVLVDGEPVQLTPSVARSLFAPVPQEPFLFDDTIGTNVLCGRPEASSTQVEAACRAAGVTMFTDQLPAGLDEPAGPGGSLLSVGQRQRVCLARALLSHAPVLLLDEVTASLDGRTEQTLTEELDRYLSGRAVLVVTHRLTTARWADRIALLEDGKVKFQGSLQETGAWDDSLLHLFAGQLSDQDSKEDRLA